jgi:hypothetical protein
MRIVVDEERFFETETTASAGALTRILCYAAEFSKRFRYYVDIKLSSTEIYIDRFCMRLGLQIIRCRASGRKMNGIEQD